MATVLDQSTESCSVEKTAPWTETPMGPPRESMTARCLAATTADSTDSPRALPKAPPWAQWLAFQKANHSVAPKEIHSGVCSASPRAALAAAPFAFGGVSKISTRLFANSETYRRPPA